LSARSRLDTMDEDLKRLLEWNREEDIDEDVGGRSCDKVGEHFEHEDGTLYLVELYYADAAGVCHKERTEMTVEEALEYSGLPRKPRWQRLKEEGKLK